MVWEEWDIRVIRGRRRTIAIQIDENLVITVKAPYRASDKYIERFVEEKSPWIRKHIQKIKERTAAKEEEPAEKMSAEELKKLAGKARDHIPERVRFYALQVGVDYGNITIRSQKTRWGSCSSRGNLNFNCLLMLTPPEIIDYVVVHELCHLLEMNHSPRFWQEVERIIPDYKKRRKWLRDNGGAVMKRMTG